jgi:hypothetical protein
MGSLALKMKALQSVTRSSCDIDDIPEDGCLARTCRIVNKHVKKGVICLLYCFILLVYVITEWARFSAVG